MKRWRYSLGEKCGGAPNCRIPQGDPLQEIWVGCEPDTPGHKPLKRCRRHAHSEVPDRIEQQSGFVQPETTKVKMRRSFDVKQAAAGE